VSITTATGDISIFPIFHNGRHFSPDSSHFVNFITIAFLDPANHILDTKMKSLLLLKLSIYRFFHISIMAAVFSTWRPAAPSNLRQTSGFVISHAYLRQKTQ